LLRAWFFAVVVYPRTELFEWARQSYPQFELAEGEMVAQRTWAEKDFYSQVTGLNLSKICRDANRRFYLRPWVIFMLIWRTPKNWFLVRGIYWGMRAVLTSLFKLETVFHPLRTAWNRLRRHRTAA
jgi:hypothetical protein